MSKEENLNEEELEQKEEQPIEEETQQLTAEEEAIAKYNEINDKYLRLYSDFENFRKRTQKEKIDLYKTAGEDVISAVLPVIDDFERAQKAMQESDDIKGVKDGVKLVHDKLLNILKQKGLEEIKSAVNKDFDIEFHEAITQIPAPNKKLVGKVIDEVEKGYQLNGKVIRFTKVVVGK
jgi:molecular chaperone GrpE